MKKERNITIKLIENKNINNHMLIEFFVKKINETGIKNNINKS